MDVVIRKATFQDAVCISLLGRVTFDDTFGHLFRNRDDVLNYLDATFSVSKIKSSLQKENNAFWIAFVDELPVGYAKLKKRNPLENLPNKNIAQLQKIYIQKDFLAHKIGSKLQSNVIEEAIKSGATHLWLSVLESNHQAINFYLKHQFKKEGTLKFNIGQENFVFDTMVLSLD